MPHRLAAGLIAVEVKAVAIIGNTLAGSNLLRRQHHPADNFGVVVFELVERSDLALGNDQNMHRRLRVDVAERQQIVIFPDNVGRNLAVDDFFEQVFGHSWSPRGGTALDPPDNNKSDPTEANAELPRRLRNPDGTAGARAQEVVLAFHDVGAYELVPEAEVKPVVGARVLVVQIVMRGCDQVPAGKPPQPPFGEY